MTAGQSQTDAEGVWRWSMVSLYAVAMAWVEAAVVFYLRNLTGRTDPHQNAPPLGPTPWEKPEMIREFATLVMLFAVGWLAGRTRRSRLGYGLIAFGVWDIFYYIFLKLITGWPQGWLDWDILFLLPLPWWGPVVAPMLIAGLLVLGGTLLSQFDTPERPLWPARASVACSAFGAVLALYVFMADALHVVSQGPAALRNLLPETFRWSPFLVACLLMAVPILDLACQLWGRRLAPAAP